MFRLLDQYKPSSPLTNELNDYSIFEKNASHCYSNKHMHLMWTFNLINTTNFTSHLFYFVVRNGQAVFVLTPVRIHFRITKFTIYLNFIFFLFSDVFFFFFLDLDFSFVFCLHFFFLLIYTNACVLYLTNLGVSIFFWNWKNYQNF